MYFHNSPHDCFFVYVIEIYIIDKLSHFLLFINSPNDSFHVPTAFSLSFPRKMNKIQQSTVMRFDVYIVKKRSRFQVNVHVL